MSTVERAREVLRQAETNLRQLVSQSAAAGEYESVVQIASWASALKQLLPGENVGRGNGPSAPPSAKKAARRAVRHPKRTQGRRGESEYPRFFRRDEELVRVAWSKRDKREYQHKAPYSTLQAIVATIGRLGKDGRVFSTDQILPLRDTEGSDLPNYQAYVGIALLKKVGLIDQHGRQGYSVPQLADFENAVSLVWKNLPTH